MEEITILFIVTPWRAHSHQWVLNPNGLVNYQGNLVEPRYVYENFEIDYPMFRVIRAEVCQKVNNPDNSHRPYSWVTLERFDG